MIAKAIFSTPNSMSTLADIYNFLIVKYPFLQTRGKSWKNSVRHTLSLNEWFIKIPKLDNAKCCYWSIHPVYIQRFRRGDFQKQRKASIPKFRSQHHHHHNTRYYDMSYDISPTLDYHFYPPPQSHHFQQENSSVSPHSAFSPWPISSRPQFEEFQTFFPPPHSLSQQQQQQQQYSHHHGNGYPTPHPPPVYNQAPVVATSPHPPPQSGYHQQPYYSYYNAEHVNNMVYRQEPKAQEPSHHHYHDVRNNRNVEPYRSSVETPKDTQTSSGPQHNSDPNDPPSCINIKIEGPTDVC